VLAGLSRPGPFGRVANSLPFYGSHGGVIRTSRASTKVGETLLARYHERNREAGVRWATMVGNPFAAQPDGALSPTYLDRRIGQLTPLPSAAGPDEVATALLDQCHQKTRNMIRKGMRQGYVISHDGGAATVGLLAKMHRENLQAIGGIAKDRGVFDAIVASFEYDADYRIYRADTADGERAAALLLFYFKDFVEYFVPASAERHRQDQPLSALIHRAMADAVSERGAKWWNWGGTWPSQEGVHRFKARWGTEDREYHYRIWDYAPEKSLAGIDRAVLASRYPYFYTVPYGALPQ
jgi:hypothetical protein